ncbi:MAG TPA: RHS repeat-associated core domain-containing protein, partial [Candidatus Angelobacter sp.]
NTVKFTGQYRDTDTAANLDYFGARYYSNTIGRFMSPDWAAKPTTVPYAKFGDPQSLNLYSYVENGPINRIDSDGHNYAGWNGAYADTTGGFTEMDNEVITEWGINSEGRTRTQAANDAMQQQQAKQQQNQQQQPPTGNNVQPWDLRDTIVDLFKSSNTCSIWFNGGDAKNTQAIKLISWDDMRLYEGPITEHARTSSYSGATIYINTKGGFYSANYVNVKGTDGGEGFEPGTFLARMIIELHELAHQVQPSGFTHDGGNVKASEANTQRVIDHCLIPIIDRWPVASAY